MKFNLFPTLAWSGIKKNKKLYIPYLLSCIGSVMMTYIINYVSVSPAVKAIKGGATLGAMLSIGKFVMAVFILIFLMYTNSFLIRKRNKEFGLYNILGMDKKGISNVIVWESVIVTAISLVAGLFFGIAFSKLAEMYLLYISHAETSFNLYISPVSILYTLIVFAVIFVILLIKSVITVHKTDPLELMKSENIGEKPPKANWIIAVLGVILLGVAYYFSATTNNPLDALVIFLIAVILVIVSTYMLFMAGSVALCKILQKNKKYYYKKNHFVSVSSMAYRMKRNGAGLASICILSTMVLVMIASSASLYFGADDAIRARFPEQNEITPHMIKIDHLQEEYIAPLREEYEKIFENNSVKPERVVEYKYAAITGMLEDNKVDPDSSNAVNSMVNTSNLRQIFFMDINEYNRIMKTKISLDGTDAILHTLRCSYNKDTFEMSGVKLNIRETKSGFPELNDAKVSVFPSMLIVVSDMDLLKPLEGLADFNGDPMLSVCWHYGYDLKAASETTVTVHKQICDAFSNAKSLHKENGGYNYESSCFEEEKGDFFATFGGLFFIGIMFSIMFIFAMAMIIYYKQISEGFEDQSRFTVMQNVGMTKKDIRKSINSQTLTVFFAPLLFAGLHLGFAFPPIWKILQLFNLHNLNLIILVSIIAFVVFAVIYLAIYKATSRTYYSIVSAKE